MHLSLHRGRPWHRPIAFAPDSCPTVLGPCRAAPCHAVPRRAVLCCAGQPLRQVHKARLRRFSPAELKGAMAPRQQEQRHTAAEGESAWDVCNRHGVALSELRAANKGGWSECILGGRGGRGEGTVREDGRGREEGAYVVSRRGHWARLLVGGGAGCQLAASQQTTKEQDARGREGGQGGGCMAPARPRTLVPQQRCRGPGLRHNGGWGATVLRSAGTLWMPGT